MFRVSWQLSETEHIISNGLLPALTTMVRQHITTTNGLVDEALALHRTVEVSPVTSLLAGASVKQCTVAWCSSPSTSW